MKYTYIEVMEYGTAPPVVVRRIDVSDKSEKQIDRIDSGININLSHNSYYTKTKKYNEQQPLEPTKQ